MLGAAVGGTVGAVGVKLGLIDGDNDGAAEG